MGWPDNIPGSNTPRETIGSLSVAGFPIEFEATKLQDAQKHFGGKIGYSGDASTALSWLCLYGSDSDGSWLLWLWSEEMDGPNIGGFQWRRLFPDERPDARCAAVPGRSEEIRLPIALRPGASKQEVTRILGMPALIRKDRLYYEHERSVAIGGIDYTVSNSLAIAFRNDQVYELQAGKLTSN